MQLDSCQPTPSRETLSFVEHCTRKKKRMKNLTRALESLFLSWIIFFQVASRLTDGLSHNCCSQLQFFSSGTLSYDVSIWVLWGDMGRGPRCRMSFRSLEKRNQVFSSFLCPIFVSWFGLIGLDHDPKPCPWVWFGLPGSYDKIGRSKPLQKWGMRSL